MSSDVEVTLRGPDAYRVARLAMDSMEANKVWPTALNFELWTHFVIDPNGALGKELSRLIASGEALTETLSEELAAAYLPKARLNDQIRDAGDLLSKELFAVSQAIQQAQASNAAFGKTLTVASKELAAPQDAHGIRTMVDTLATATRRVQRQNQSLEKRLEASTAEVDRLKEHLEQVRRDATTDGLTNLANRKAFDDELDRACAEADAAGTSLTLALLDIDHFKNFNDTWGHQTGDQVLRLVAMTLKSNIKGKDMAARYGGEEFAAILPETDLEGAIIVADNIRKAIQAKELLKRSTNEKLGRITASMGVAMYKPGDTPASLIERADRCLYAAKHAGRNRVLSENELKDDVKIVA